MLIDSFSHVKKNSCTFICYNEFTHFTGYTYAGYIKMFSRYNCSLIWRDSIMDLPEKAFVFWDKLHKIQVIQKDLYKKSIARKALSYASITRSIYRDRKLAELLNHTHFLFVFKDNSIYDASIIRLFKKRKNTIVIHIDEGISLYLNRKSPVKLLLRVATHFMGIPKECLLNQGESNRVNFIICRHPDLMNGRNIYNKLILLQSNIYRIAKTHDYMKSIHSLSIPHKIDIDVLYIGQPLSEDGFLNLESETSVLSQIIVMLGSNLMIGIKLHPREKKGKYNRLLECHTNLMLLDESIQNLPAEIIFSFFDNPVIATPFSSVASNINAFFPDSRLFIFYHLFNLQPRVKSELDIVYKKLSLPVVTEENIETEMAILTNEIAASNKKVEAEKIPQEFRIPEIDTIMGIRDGI